VTYYLALAALLWAYMSLWFVISLIKKRNDVADIAWGLGFVLVAWASFILAGTASARGLLVGLLVSIWGLRLAWHIHARHRGKAEDYRYRAWREEWGRWFYLRSYVQVYLLQGGFLFLIAAPVLLINASASTPLGILDALGVVVWLIGFYFEAVGDAQLARFIADPGNKGKLLQDGLWGYTRHPNYFGEAAQWWGLWIIALSVPNGRLAIIGPITITFLLLKVSGIPLLEKRMEQHPDFAAYKARVSIFVPLPPRN
jgi:steroid 5-alpha reductase family enzyme